MTTVRTRAPNSPFTRPRGGPRRSVAPAPPSVPSPPSSLPTPFRLLPLFLPVLLLAGVSRGVAAQEVDGRLLEAEGEEPVGSAVVRLLDPGDRIVDAGLSGEEGEFLLESVRPGSFRIEVERIGFETWRSPEFRLGEGERVERAFRIRVRPVRLEGIVAEGRGKCRVDPESSRATALLWQEISKALARERDVRAEGSLRFHVREYDRMLDARLRVQNERGGTKVITGRTPYRSAPPEELASLGFVVREGEHVYYRAPDAEAVLSPIFQRTHCYGVVREESRLGLAFRPADGRVLPEVRGVLWVDPESAKLEELAFRYVHLDLAQPVPDESAAGSLEFEELPDGRWIVRRWWIRWPHTLVRQTASEELARRALRQGSDLEREGEARITRYREVGGEVERVESAGEEPVTERRIVGRGQIAGSVFDSLGGAPLAGATVRLEGTRRVTRSTPSGEFRFDRVPPGRYRVSWDHPRVSWMGDVTPEAEVRVDPGWVSEAELATPGPGRLHALLCGPEEAGGGVVGRVVRPGTGEPAPGTAVRFELADRPTDVPRVLAEAMAEARGPDVVRTDETGGFVVCGVPTGRPVTVRSGEGARTLRLAPERPLEFLQFEVEAPRTGARGAGTETAAAGSEASGALLLGEVRELPGTRESAGGDGRDAASERGDGLAGDPGRPLVGAFVRLAPGDRVMVARRGGVFRFGRLAGGTHLVSVDHPGFVDDSVAVEVLPDAVTLVRIGVPPDSVAGSATPRVTATRTVRDPDLRAFYGRMANGAGHFVTGEWLSRLGWLAALREVPDVTLRPCRDFEGREIPDCRHLAVDLGPGTPDRCEAAVRVDGRALEAGEGRTPFQALRELPAEEVEGLEIHGPSTAPGPHRGEATPCGAVLVWTRR